MNFSQRCCIAGHTYTSCCQSRCWKSPTVTVNNWLLVAANRCMCERAVATFPPPQKHPPTDSVRLVQSYKVWAASSINMLIGQALNPTSSALIGHAALGIGMGYLLLLNLTPYLWEKPVLNWQNAVGNMIFIIGFSQVLWWSHTACVEWRGQGFWEGALSLFI